MRSRLSCRLYRATFYIFVLARTPKNVRHSTRRDVRARVAMLPERLMSHFDMASALCDWGHEMANRLRYWHRNGGRRHRVPTLFR